MGPPSPVAVSVGDFEQGAAHHGTMHACAPREVKPLNIFKRGWPAASESITVVVQSYMYGAASRRHTMIQCHALCHAIVHAIVVGPVPVVRILVLYVCTDNIYCTAVPRSQLQRVSQ